MFYIIILSCLLACRAEFGDEMQLYETECLGENRFICLDGGCILHEKYCDGKPDCADGSDENFCPDHPPNEHLCNVTHQYLCRDGHACIPATWVCNGAPDCADASDEANCTALPETSNSTTPSKCGDGGFACGDGTCISSMWMCDGRYDCKDRSDEDIETTCRHSLKAHSSGGLFCSEFPIVGSRRYECADSSFCLWPEQMCNNITDCRDGSDEGAFCGKWQTMCVNTTCPKNITECTPERYGPRCVCDQSPNSYQFNETTSRCQDVDECLMERPSCSHRCENFPGHFKCECDPGYIPDDFSYLCFAQGPEARLFFSTEKDIRYIKVKTKQEVIVATGIKKSHGVSYDGRYLYWVETADGHQAIARAHLENPVETKEILVSLGLYDAGDVAVDWLAGNIYFSDTARGSIYVCKIDGSMCARLNAETFNPKFVTLDIKKGIMYWADVAGREGGFVIMRARMDGSGSELLLASLSRFAAALTVDAPNDRLYFLDRTVRVLQVNTRQVYSLFEERFHHPLAVAVFENTVYWSDWTSNTIQTTDKLHTTRESNLLATLHAPVVGMHIYHPVLINRDTNPCSSNRCSHMCLLTSNTTHSCACPVGMKLNGTACYNEPNYRPKYLIVGAGASFTRIRYDSLGNPESHATTLDIGRVQAMAYDSRRDVLYIYDAMRKSINSIEMSDFTLGVTHIFAQNGLENVVDMDYDYVTDTLYVLDAGRRFLEVFSLKDGKRALLHRFPDQEIPVSFCIMQHFGRLLVAVVESEQNNEVHVDSIGLDGDAREHQHVLMNNLKGPRVKLRNLYDSDMVAVSDEGSNTLEFIQLRTLPRGSRHDLRKQLPTAAVSLAVTAPYVFWSDGRTRRVFWDEYRGTAPPRRVELSIFPNETHLHLQATTEAPDLNLSPHPCTQNPCSHICVQTPRLPILGSLQPVPLGHVSYKCLCPPGLLVEGGNCTRLAECRGDELYCHKSNKCVPMIKRCDGEKDCENGEDEEECSGPTPIPSGKCYPSQVECNGGCIPANEVCPQSVRETITLPFYCEFEQFQCRESRLCLEREQVCDQRADCPDGSDEGPLCHTLRCLETEFMCTSGNCILASWRCDGDADCADGSDEAECAVRSCNVSSYQCRNGQCVELHRRCDGQSDCVDGSDEERCQEESNTAVTHSCGDGEVPCERNKTICLPQTAWFGVFRVAGCCAVFGGGCGLLGGCNSEVDCPGGTDEQGCPSFCAAHGLYECKQEQVCLSMRRVCNHNRDCKDGSDETPEACDLVNRTSNVFLQPYPAAECKHGFLCRTGQCIEWREVCDQTPDCFDGSDENGLCFTACEKNTCSHDCQPTPLGAQCICKTGFELKPDGRSCTDVDECVLHSCTQHCVNYPGSFLCTCRHGYSLRSDRRTCKANIQSSKNIVYASGHKVWSILVDRESKPSLEFEDPSLGTIADIDINIAQKKMYVTSSETGKLIEVAYTEPGSIANISGQNVISNIGKPIKVAVEWVTGNVYFVDNSTEPSIKVCNFQKKRCAKLNGLPGDGTVTSLAVSPESRKLYYSVSYNSSTLVTEADLSGQNQKNTEFSGFEGVLALDGSMLYVANELDLWRVDPGRSIIALGNYSWRTLFPRSIDVFEDYVYILGFFRISRCLMFGDLTCKPIRLLDAEAFVIRHPSLQQTVLKNECDGYACENVCVLGEKAPRCICGDGRISEDGRCGLVDKALEPLYNGVSSQDMSQEHHVSATLISITVFLFVTYLAIFVYYHCVYRPRREALTLPVRFQNQTSINESSIETPAIEMPTTSGTAHEFVNPLQFVRSFWQRSFRSNRPIGTAGLAFDIPRPKEDVSDTESDMDYKDEMNLIT